MDAHRKINDMKPLHISLQLEQSMPQTLPPIHGCKYNNLSDFSWGSIVTVCQSTLNEMILY